MQAHKDHCPSCKNRLGNVSVPSKVKKNVRYCGSYCRSVVEGGVQRFQGSRPRRLSRGSLR